MSEFDVDDLLPDKKPSSKSLLSEKDASDRFYRMRAFGDEVGQGNKQIIRVPGMRGKTPSPRIEGYSYSLGQPTFSQAVLPSVEHFEDLHELAAKIEAHAAAHDAFLGANDMHPDDREAATGHLDKVWSALADFHKSNSAGITKHLSGNAYTATSAERIMPRGRRNVADVVGSEGALGSIGHHRDAVAHLTAAVGHLRNASVFSGLGVDRNVNSVPAKAQGIHTDYVNKANEANNTDIISRLRGTGSLSTAGSADDEVDSAKLLARRLPVQPQSRTPRTSVTPGPGVTVQGRERQLVAPTSPEVIQETMESQRIKEGRPAWAKSPNQIDVETGKQIVTQRVARQTAASQAKQRQKFQNMPSGRGKPMDITPEQMVKDETLNDLRVKKLTQTPPLSPTRKGEFDQFLADARARIAQSEEGSARFAEARQRSVARASQQATQQISEHLSNGRYTEAAIAHLHNFGVNEAKAPKTYLKHQNLIKTDPIKYLSQEGYDLGIEKPAQTRTKTSRKSRRSKEFFPQEIKERETRVPTTPTSSPFTPAAEAEYKSKLIEADKATKEADASGRRQRMTSLGMG